MAKTVELGQTRWVRLRARANNIAVRRFAPVAEPVMRWHARHPDGVLGRAYTRVWLSAPVYTLTVAGRKSGVLRPVALMQVFRGDELVVLGGNAGAATTPDWFLNLRAAGEAVVDVEGERWPVSFREITDPVEARECTERFAAVYPGMLVYREHCERDFPVGVLTRK